MSIARLLQRYPLSDSETSHLKRMAESIVLDLYDLQQKQDEVWLRSWDRKSPRRISDQDWLAMQKLIQDRHAALFNHFGLALLEHTDSIEDPRVDLQSAAYIVVQHAMGLWAEVMGGREFDKNHVEPEVLLRDKVTLAVERFRRHYTVEVLRRRKLLGDPNSGQSARDPRAPTDAAISAEEQKVRGELRSRWLDDRYAEKDWTSDLDLEQARGPSYNTIQRYRSGKKSNQERSVRQLIAKALGCKPAEVPE